MIEPRTEAGRELLEMEAYNSRSFPLITVGRVVAIEDEAAPTVEALAAELHERYGPALCIGAHFYTEPCDAPDQWRSEARAILAALRDGR